MAIDSRRRSMPSALLRLVRECLSRSGVVATVFALIVGGTAGFLVSQQVTPTDAFWTNSAVLTVVGIVIGFVIDLLLVSPMRLWRDAEVTVATATSLAENEQAHRATAEAEATKQRERADTLQEQLNQVTVNTNAWVLRGAQTTSSGTAATPEQATGEETAASDSQVPAPPTITSDFITDATFSSYSLVEPKAHLIVQDRGLDITCSCGWIGPVSAYDTHRKGPLTYYLDASS